MIRTILLALFFIGVQEICSSQNNTIIVNSYPPQATVSINSGPTKSTMAVFNELDRGSYIVESFIKSNPIDIKLIDSYMSDTLALLKNDSIILTFNFQTYKVNTIKIKKTTEPIADLTGQNDTRLNQAKKFIKVIPKGLKSFYYGLPNPIKISVPGIPSSSIFLTITDNATINKIGDDSYEVNPIKEEGKIDIQVHAKTEEVNELLDVLSFNIKTISKPKVKVMGMGGGKISRVMLSKAPGVYAELEDYYSPDFKFQIIGFSLVTVHGIYAKTFYSKGAMFSKEASEAISLLGRNDKVYIEEVVVKQPDGKTVTLSPIKFTIK